MIKRVFLVVLDSFGIGELPDAKRFGDEGSNTLLSVETSKYLNVPNMQKMGLFNINDFDDHRVDKTNATYLKMDEESNGKDSTVGHWEIAGVITKEPLPTFPNGFPDEIMEKITKEWGVGYLCNKPYSGTEVIKDYGVEHLKTGKPIVYTSADSVFQIACHKKVMSIEKLYELCKSARKLLKGKYGVGRVIARPFDGEYPFVRTDERHDFSIDAPEKTMLDYISESGKDMISIGKIEALFAGRGITQAIQTSNNREGMDELLKIEKTEFNGLCFANLVDFDMLYGHRNDVDGYAKALSEFDDFLTKFIPKMEKDDVLIITADHGCDPLTVSTDHSREYVPVLIYGSTIKRNNQIETQNTFANLGKTVLDMLNIENDLYGESFYNEIKKETK